jgi:glycosyltransferase involved in cell wall biosynthesis
MLPSADPNCPVTIGLPVLNGARTLRRSIDSLLAQTHRDFRLVIADNASTDDTPAIIADYAARDPRVTVIRRPETVSPIENFGDLVRRATTPFFMFATDDDIWRPGFVAATLAALRADPAASLCVSRIRFLDGDAEGDYSTGTAAISGTPVERIDRYLRQIGENGRYYGLHRTPALAAGFALVEPMPAFDWLALVPSVLAGHHLELPETLLLRERTPIANYRIWTKRLEPSVAGRIMPHLRMARATHAVLPPELRHAAVPALARLTIESAANSPYGPVRSAYAAALRVRKALR